MYNRRVLFLLAIDLRSRRHKRAAATAAAAANTADRQLRSQLLSKNIMAYSTVADRYSPDAVS